MTEPSKRRRRPIATIHVDRGGAPESQKEIELTADEGVDLTQLWATLRENASYILKVAAVVTVVVMAHTMHSMMTFRVNGRLYLGDLEVRGRAASPSADMDISGVAQGDVGSEIEILKSQSLVTRAILASGVNVAITPQGWHEPRFWEWLMAERNPSVLDIPAKELLAVNTALSDSSLGSQTYRVSFLTPDTYEVSSEEAILGRQKLGVPLNIGRAIMNLQRGTERGPQQGAVYYVRIDPLDTMTSAVLGSLVVTAAKGVGVEAAKVVTLEFSHSSPFFATTFLRSLMSGYLNERQAWKTEDASAAEDFVTDQLGTLRESLDKSQQRLAEYRSNTRVVVLDNEAKAMIEQVGKYEEQRVSARLLISALIDIKRALKLPNPPTEAFMLGEAQDTVLQQFSKSLSEARQLLDQQIEQYGADSSYARKQQGQVDVQLDMIRNYVSSRLARAQESLNSLNGIIAQFEDKLKTVPGAELGLAQLGRESEVYSRVYSYMLERQQQAAITKASTISKNRILDYPQTPYREDAPKLGLRLASAPLGLLLGAVLVMLHRLFASSFQSEGEIRRLAGGTAVFGRVPLRAKVKSQPVDQLPHDIDLLGGSLNSPFAEAFRTVRTGLYQWRHSEEGRVALITSASPGDGKTTCVMGLAAILAADKKRVMVVDADLRKPSHQDLTNTPHGPGLRSVLSGQMEWREVTHRVELTVGSYDAIGAGKMAPAELLSSERMERFLSDLREHYDFILLDSPSFPLVADALVLAEVSDCVLSVLRVGHTPRKVAVEHVERLANVASTYGVVINDTTQLGSPYPLMKRERLSWLRNPFSKGVFARLMDRRLLAVIVVVGAAMLASLVTKKRRAAEYEEARHTASQPGAQSMPPHLVSPDLPAEVEPVNAGAEGPPPTAVPSAAPPTTADMPAQASQPAAPVAPGPAQLAPVHNADAAYNDWIRERFPQIVESAQDRASRMRREQRPIGEAAKGGVRAEKRLAEQPFRSATGAAAGTPANGEIPVNPY